MNLADLNRESQQLWNDKAEFWDELYGDEGNLFHRKLVSPAVESLLNLRAGERVLDIACGSGVLSRRLAALGGHVTGVDFSEGLLAKAKLRTQSSDTHITYQQVDATDEAALVALGSFDAITCTMALMDIPTLAPMFYAVSQMLPPHGRFVFATAHPAFNSSNPIFFVELEDRGGELIETKGVKISQYLDVAVEKAVGAAGESNPHYNFHRPLHDILNAAFAAGLVLNGLEEPRYVIEDGDKGRQLSWRDVPQIPPVLAGRLILQRAKEA